jgi:enterochelin esterase-like enzyme
MQKNLPKPSTGRLQRLEHFASKFVDARHIDVWLPKDFDGSKHYSVLYMHDGQMLFDASQTWNAQAWNIDVAISSLIGEGRIPETLVVGIWNNGEQRHSEYFPQKFLPTLSPKFRDEFVAGYLCGKPQSDDYLRFLVEELKPHIDQQFPTRPEREHTFVMGSSMGGLISVYAMSEYPEIFGGAAGLSIAWIGMGKPNFELPLAAFNYLQGSLAPAQGHRLYMDHGTTEMDAMYAPYQAFVDEIVRDRGYDSSNLQSRVFEGTGHNELAWAERLHIPLEFLLGHSGKSER